MPPKADEPAIPEEGPAQKPAGSIGYVLVPGSNKLEVLARQLSQGKGEEGPPPAWAVGGAGIAVLAGGSVALRARARRRLSP